MVEKPSQAHTGATARDFARRGRLFTGKRVFFGFDILLFKVNVLKNTLPRRLIRLRELLHLSQTGLAEKAGISPTTVNELESGLARDVKVSTLLAITRAGATPDWLLGFDRAAATPTEGIRVAEAVYELHCQGWETERIAVRLGLHGSSVEHILDMEYETRRLRRHVFPDHPA